jgi:hypothetical protein
MAAKALTAGVLLVKGGRKELKKHLDYLNPTFRKLLF